MKIIYIAYWDMSQESGVLKKIISQLQEWRDQGNEIELLSLTPSPLVWEGVGKVPVKLFIRGNLLTRFNRVSKLAGQAANSRPDIIYMRFSTFFPAISALAAKIPMVLEINTDDRLEYRRTLPRAKYLYHKLTKDRLLSKASGFVFVTNELRQKFASYEKPSLVIGNGIDLLAHQVSSAPDNPQPRLAFVGSPGLEWHGVDKVLELANLRTQWQFDIVGPLAETVDAFVPRNVTFHAFLKRRDYMGLLQSADIAIGTLALHRIGMSEASPLKVREYLACGLPTIIGYRDTDFPSGAPFLLEIPNTPNSIQESMSRIDEFVKCWKGKRVPRSEVAHLDVRIKEKGRMVLFQLCLAASKKQEKSIDQ